MSRCVNVAREIRRRETIVAEYSRITTNKQELKLKAKAEILDWKKKSEKVALRFKKKSEKVALSFKKSYFLFLGKDGSAMPLKHIFITYSISIHILPDVWPHMSVMWPVSRLVAFPSTWRDLTVKTASFKLLDISAQLLPLSVSAIHVQLSYPGITHFPVLSHSRRWRSKVQFSSHFYPPSVAAIRFR